MHNWQFFQIDGMANFSREYYMFEYLISLLFCIFVVTFNFNFFLFSWSQ